MRPLSIVVASIVAALLAAPAVCAKDAEPTGLWRDVDVEAVASEIPGADTYPDADAVFGLVQEIISVADDGSMSIDRNLLVRILTLNGREEYSNQTFLYNSDLSELSVVKGRTVRASGRSKEVDEDAVNDVTPAFLAGATVYANVLEKVVSFPVAGAGSTLELQLHESRLPSSDGSFSGVEHMGGADPSLRHELRLEYPTGLTIRTHRTAGIHADQTITEERADGSFVWRMEDIVPVVSEDNMPPRLELLPLVIYSSYEDWNGPAALFAEAFLPHVQTDGAAAARAKELTAGLGSKDEIVRAIFLDVATNVRNVNLKLGLGGYEPNDADVVLANLYGDTRDKAVLLISMLRAVGVEAYPAMVKSTLGSFVEEVPTLLQFDRMLVALPEDGGYGFLDPFLDDVVYGFDRWGRGNTALVVTDEGTGELVAVPRFTPDENASRRVLVAELDADGAADVEVVSDATGWFDRSTRMSLKDATPSEKKQILERGAHRVSPGAVYTGEEFSDLSDLVEPASVAMKIESPDFAVRQGDMMIVRVPEFPFAFTDFQQQPAMSERRLPYDMPCESRVEYSATILIPSGYEVVRMPEPLEYETPDARFALECEWSETDGAARWKRTVEVRQMRVPADRYIDFKAGHDTINSPKSALILLKKTDTPD